MTEAVRATAELGSWAAALRWEEVPDPVRARLQLVVLDVLGACAAGARLPEQRALVETWDPAPGPAPLIGGGRSVSAEDAAWLNGIATVSADGLVTELGTRWDIMLGYFKRHASCSFTHPAADAVLELRPKVAGQAVEEILIETHSLGAGLDRTDWDNRLAAMFSTPFVVATALLRGRVDPAAATPPQLHDPEVMELARCVRVTVAPDLDARLPAERPARVTVRTANGGRHVHEVPNPVGDVDHHPLSEADVLALLSGLLGDGTMLGRLRDCAVRLPEAPGVGDLLGSLAAP